MSKSTDRPCGRCGISDDRVLDLDTGGAYHPEPGECIRLLRADLEAEQNRKSFIFKTWKGKSERLEAELAAQATLLSLTQSELDLALADKQAAEASAAAMRERVRQLEAACEWIINAVDGYDLISCAPDLPEGVWEEEGGDDIVVPAFDCNATGQHLLDELQAARAELERVKAAKWEGRFSDLKAELEGLRELVAGISDCVIGQHMIRQERHRKPENRWVLSVKEDWGYRPLDGYPSPLSALAALKASQHPAKQETPCPDCGDPPGKCDCAKVLAGWLGELPTEDDAIDSLEYPSP